jgi:AAA ATPase domain
MRIDEIEVVNFRGIKKVHLKDLQSTIVIAGANGSGKSCIFDAIRLLKSAYGGYQQNEWHHWMSEFQVNFAANSEAFRSFFQDQSKRLSIRCVFRLHPKEREYLERHAEELVRTSVWRLIAPEMHGWSSYRAAPMAAQYRDRVAEVEIKTTEQLKELLAELTQETIVGHLYADAGSDIGFNNSKALEILFSSYVPGELGLIDYHGPQRLYSREQVSSVNLDLSAREQQDKQHALYNYSNKYGTVKTEMASSYLKELLAKEAGVKLEGKNPLSVTLDELFETFFPDKKFLGLKPTIDGGLEFPVQISSGAIHDLNELSAGEKEILYGYLRIKNSAPCYSMILIDEPELHLNPRLIRGLPRFYHKNLGVSLDNQIWLVTHSDALLQEVVGQPEYSVFHMVGASADDMIPQIVPITLGEATETALISLVGDIAAYRPGRKVVIFEGGGDSEIDALITQRLFPDFAEKCNLISSGNKLRVRELHDVLDAAKQKGVIPFQTFSIIDEDGENDVSVTAPRYKWDTYHIENYLLEAPFVAKVLTELGGKGRDWSIEKINDNLRSAASSTLDGLVRHELTDFVNRTIVSSLDYSLDPKRQDLAVAIGEAVDRSLARIDAKSKTSLTASALNKKETALRKKFQGHLATQKWKNTFRGRDILKAFTREHCSVSYEVLRNLILARMVEAGHKPKGMKKVIDAILAA